MIWVSVRDSIVESMIAPPQRHHHCGIHGSEQRGDSNPASYADDTGRTQAWMAVVTYLMMQPEFVQR